MNLQDIYLNRAINNLMNLKLYNLIFFTLHKAQGSNIN